jgi:asparagine synthetase B (glutamine-hydrolysing)
MWTADGRVGIIFNGEIYNFAELRAELMGLGAQFVTDHSDTEVLLQAYRHWRDDCVQRLNGMWAFVIYDRDRKRLFGSRDRFGKKPLYYIDRPDLFGFASELSSLIAHSAIRPSISAGGAAQVFRLWLHSGAAFDLCRNSQAPGGAFVRIRHRVATFSPMEVLGLHPRAPRRKWNGGKRKRGATSCATCSQRR